MQQVHSGQCKSWATAIAQAYKVLLSRQFQGLSRPISIKIFVLYEIGCALLVHSPLPFSQIGGLTNYYYYCILRSLNKKIFVSTASTTWVPSLTELCHPIIATAIIWTLQMNFHHSHQRGVLRTFRLMYAAHLSMPYTQVILLHYSIAKVAHTRSYVLG